MRRDAVAQFFAELEPCIVGMEACCGSHFWARVLKDLGHEVRLISPQFVKPYVKSNKNDRNDAEAICEAVGRPSMRFVPPKSAEQLEIQAVHRIRQRVVANRTRLVNQVRGLLGEHGVVVARDITRIRRALSEVADSHEGEFGDMFTDMLRDIQNELAELDIRLAGYNRRIKNLFRSNEMCQRIGQNTPLRWPDSRARRLTKGGGSQEYCSICQEMEKGARPLLLEPDVWIGKVDTNALGAMR